MEDSDGGLILVLIYNDGDLRPGKLAQGKKREQKKESFERCRHGLGRYNKKLLS